MMMMTMILVNVMADGYTTTSFLHQCNSNYNLLYYKQQKEEKLTILSFLPRARETIVNTNKRNLTQFKDFFAKQLKLKDIFYCGKKDLKNG